MGKHFSRKKIIALACGVIAIAGIGVLIWSSADDYSHVNCGKYISLGEIPEPVEIEDVKPEKGAVEAEAEKAYNQAKNEARRTTGDISDGDTVFVDYISSVDGRLVDGGSGEDVPVRIGESDLPFAEELEDHAVGDTVKTEVKIPGDYANKEVAGKTVTFEIKITAARGDLSYKEFLKDSGFKSDKEYKTVVRERLSAELTREEKKRAQENAWAKILTETSVKKYPKRLVRKEAKNELALSHGYAAAHGMGWSEYQKKILRIKKSEAAKIAKISAEAKVKEKLTAYAIAKEKGLKLTDETYAAWEKKYCEEKGVSEENVENTYGMTWEEYKEKSDFKSMALIDMIKGGL